MSWSDLNRNQKLVSVFTILTGLMHLAFSPQWSEEDLLGPITLMMAFIVNGIGFFVILYFLYFSDNFKDKQNTLRMVLSAWTLGSVIGWLVFHPGGNYLDSSLSNKIVEVFLLVFLYLDMKASSDSSTQ